jgi:PLP dependent protein
MLVDPVLHELNRQRLIQNWQRTVQDVAASVEQAGRENGSVRIIGVSKYVTSEIAQALHEAGCSDLGESRPQQLIEKTGCLTDDAITWHLIGHLQRNKARRMVELADWIHSVDSLKLLETIAGYSQQTGRTPNLLIEVNVSGDSEKHGFKVDELAEGWPAIAAVPGIRICGLMAMAGIDADRSATQAQFAAVRRLRNEIQDHFGSPLPELSMGMSGDFDIAIQEGATMIRVGSRLFEGVVD